MVVQMAPRDPAETMVIERDVPITILHTCDLHGNLLPTESYEGKTNVGLTITWGKHRLRGDFAAGQDEAVESFRFRRGDVLFGAGDAVGRKERMRVQVDLEVLRPRGWLVRVVSRAHVVPRARTAAHARRGTVLSQHTATRARGCLRPAETPAIAPACAEACAEP